MSTTLLPAAPVPAPPAAPRRRGRAVAALLVGLLGAGLAVVLPFAPVVTDRTTVTWPSQGEQPTSTTALFVPYRPAEVHAEVPCAAVRAALDTDGRTTLLATTVVRDAGPVSGLVIDTDAGRLRVMVNGRVVQTATPAGDCDVRVDSDDAGTTIAVGGDEPTVLDGEPVPEVFAFTTDLEPGEAEGTTVTARTRTWFESAASGLKLALTGAQIAMVLLSLLLLSRWVVRPSQGPRVRRGPRLGGAFAVICDVVVVGALSLWAVIAPQTADDGYALMTIRNGQVSGDIGNYYHWMNASEAPFTLVQHIVSPLAAVSLAPLWLRLPSYLVGILTWFVVSRGVLPAVLPAAARTRVASILAAVFFLAWWLPFNTGLRPEPFVALGAATVLALLLRGTAPTARRPLLLIGAAALVAGLSFAVTPSGVVVLAPVLVMLPRIWRTLRASDAAAGSGWWATAGIAALLGCLASTGLVVMFADQSWHGVAKATELHTVIGPNLAWYQELERYYFLLGPGIQGTATKRLAVLLTIGMLLVVVPVLVRRLPALRGFPAPHLLTATAALPFAILFVTPSKWSHHFGSLAGLGAAFLTVACLLLLQVVRERTRDRFTVGLALAGVGVLALVAGLSFSGANGWLLYDNYGLPYAFGPVTPFGVPLGNPATWLLVAAAAAAVGFWLRSRARTGRDASLLVALPAAVALAAAAASVAVLLVGFGLAPLRQAQAGGFSPTATTAAALTGNPAVCGVTESVEVLLDDPDGPLEPVDDEDEVTEGFVTDGGYLATLPPPPEGSGAASRSWGSLGDAGELDTGTLVSRWFTLPELTDGQDVAVTAAGRTVGANSLELEFGRSGGEESATTPLARRAVGNGPADLPTWRPLSVAATDVPADADRVRVVATDASADVGGWLAVTGPRVRTAETLRSYLAGRGPVLPDWPLAGYVPCAGDFPVVADGLAQTPDVVIAAPSGYAGLAAIAYVPDQGGSFAGVSMAEAREVPSRLVGAPAEEWGRVVQLHYPLGRDLYDRSTDQTTLWGWEGDR